ncbi:MAG: hypothetical protein ACRDFZ_03745 [Candidatus Limnocylindria bacterium]
MGDLRPNLILVGVVAVTLLMGLGAGAIWAFIGGLTVNLLTTDPLGSVPLGLLLTAGLVAGIGGLFGSHGAVLALIGGLLGSLVADVVGLVVLVIVGGAPIAQPGTLAGLLVPTAMLNGILAGLAFVAARAALGRLDFQPSPTRS